MKAVILHIDTSESTHARVGLTIDGKHLEKIEETGRQKSQAVLPLIESLLKEYVLTPGDITEIQVSLGPGSYTGIRVGVAVANTLGLFLHIPINGSMAPAVPFYE